MAKIRVLEVCNNLGIGGTERAMQDFALNLDKKRFDVRVAAYDTTGPRRKILEAAEIEVIQVDHASLEKYVKEQRIQVVHSHCIRVNSLIGKAINIHEVVFSGTFNPKASMNLIISQTLALKISKCTRIAYGKDFYVLYYPQSVEKWEQHLISQAEIKEERKRLGVKDGEFLIGRIGRPEPSKTDFLLIASAFKIGKQVKNAKFLFVGLPLLYRAILSLSPSLRGRMIFQKPTPDDKVIARFYQTIDAFWHTASRGETFGNVNAEAMIFAKPVITHSTPFRGDWIKEEMDNAQIEIVDHMKTGLVASYPSDVVAAVKMLIAKPSLAKKMGEAGKKKVNELFEARVVVSQFEKLIEGMLNGQKPKLKPDEKELAQYFKDYPKRLSQQVNVSTSHEKIMYGLKRKAFSALEFLYLGIRFVLRKAKIDLEK